MIVVAMTEDECIELFRRNLQNFHVVEQRHGIVSKIHQDIADLVAALGFCMH